MYKTYSNSEINAIVNTTGYKITNARHNLS